MVPPLGGNTVYTVIHVHEIHVSSMLAIGVDKHTHNKQTSSHNGLENKQPDGLKNEQPQCTCTM